MVDVGDMDRAPAAQPAFVAMIEKGKAMQVVQVPGDRSVLAIDFERIKRLVAARVAGRLKGCQRAVAEAREKGAGVVDLHLFDLAAHRMRALLDEGVGGG